ncbi:putative LysR family transcriptional regulator [Magnetofaba australis IT-1]|uniref:Putative LysR family transcriptional regulator n=2 Tax=Magnetofaba TaxID=1472292 RepID=A0A1Y2K5S6_9PROT|nr:putative LysR family transcriptional regulator [Magnetofaba australis IT-1]
MRYVLAVAQAGNFSRAAKLCHVSQPSLSVAIKGLEEELGLPIFERHKNEVSVTELGAQIITQIQKVLEEIDQIKCIAQDGADPLSGALRIGAIMTIGPYLFPNMIPAFRKLAPNMKLLVEENYTTVLTERLKRGDVDAIIIALPYQEHGVKIQSLYDEPFMAAVPAGHAWEHRPHIEGQDLATDDLILLGKGNCFRDQVLEICPDCMKMADTAEGAGGNIIEGSSLETIRHMVATAVGVSVLPASSIHSLICNTADCPAKENRYVRYVPFCEPAPKRRVALAWRSSFPNPSALQALVKSIYSAPPVGVTLLR